MIDLFRSLFAPPRHLVLLLAALWMGLALAERQAARHQVSKEQLNAMVFYSLLGYILGGRLFYALSNFTAFAQSPLSLVSPNPDLFDPVAALATTIVVAGVYARRRQLSPWGTLDALTPLLAVVWIGLSLSHLAAGTAFGSPTDAPWGIELWNATRHPTQIYELLAGMMVLVFLWTRKTHSTPGAAFLTFAALTAASRLFLEAFRGDSALIAGGFRLAQVIAWIGLAAALLVLDRSLQKRGVSQIQRDPVPDPGIETE